MSSSCTALALLVIVDAFSPVSSWLTFFNRGRHDVCLQCSQYLTSSCQLLVLKVKICLSKL